MNCPMKEVVILPHVQICERQILKKILLLLNFLAPFLETCSHYAYVYGNISVSTCVNFSCG